MKKLTIILLIFIFGISYAFSQKNETFNKKMYLGVNGAYNFPGLDEDTYNYIINLEFERQFSKHWSYTAELGVSRWVYNVRPKDYHSYTYLDVPIGMKFYSKIVNLSMGISMQWRVQKIEYDECDAFMDLEKYLFGPYLTISKDFTIFKNFKIEPYIQGGILYYALGEYATIDIYVGLRLKYGFNSKKDLQQKKQ